MVKMIQHIKVSACGRDAAMELMIKNVTRKTGVHWTKQFLETEGEWKNIDEFSEIQIYVFSSCKTRILPFKTIP